MRKGERSAEKKKVILNHVEIKDIMEKCGPSYIFWMFLKKVLQNGLKIHTQKEGFFYKSNGVFVPK